MEQEEANRLAQYLLRELNLLKEQQLIVYSELLMICKKYKICVVVS